VRGTAINLMTILAGCFLITASTLAEDLVAQQRVVLKEIRDTAADICYTIQQNGQRDDVRLSGEVEAKLNGIIKKVADLGIKGTGELRAQEYQGVLREELASTLKNSADCRRDVFNKLVEKMLPTGKDHSGLVVRIKPTLSSRFDPNIDDTIKNLRYTLFFQNTLDHPIKLYELSFEILSAEKIDHRGSRRDLSDFRAGDVKEPNYLNIFLDASGGYGQWLTKTGTDQSRRTEAATDGTLDLLRLENDKVFEFEIAGRQAETVSGAVLPTKGYHYRVRFKCSYVSDDGQIIGYSTPVLDVGEDSPHSEKSKPDQDFSSIDVIRSNASSPLRLDPNSHGEASELESAVFSATTLGIKTHYVYNSRYTFNVDNSYLPLVFSKIETVAPEDLPSLLGGLAESASIVVSDGVTNHVIIYIRHDGDRIYYQDTWYDASFLEDNRNVLGIKAIKYGKGIFSITDYELRRAFIGFSIVVDASGSITKLSSDEIVKLHSLVPESYYHSAATKFARLIADNFPQFIKRDSPQRKAYADGTPASNRSPADWLRSSEFIPPTSTVSFPVREIDQRVRELHELGVRLSLILSDRYPWSDAPKAIERMNPDVMLAFTASLGEQLKRKTGTVELFLFDEFNTMVTQLQDFRGSPSRVYFAWDGPSGKLASFGHDMGTSVREEGGNLYSIAWREYELLLAGILIWTWPDQR
jgi:hypothetical protein